MGRSETRSSYRSRIPVLIPIDFGSSSSVKRSLFPQIIGIAAILPVLWQIVRKTENPATSSACDLELVSAQHSAVDFFKDRAFMNCVFFFVVWRSSMFESWCLMQRGVIWRWFASSSFSVYTALRSVQAHLLICRNFENFFWWNYSKINW